MLNPYNRVDHLYFNQQRIMWK